MTAAELLDTLRSDNETSEIEPPEDVLRFLHYRSPDNGAGMDGRPFMAWFFACADARYIAAYSYQILRLVNETDVSLDQLKVMFGNFLTQPAEFLGYCGFRKTWSYVQQIAAVLDQVTKDELVALLVEMHMHGSHLNAWIHHYYPWGIGYAYQPNTPQYAVELSTVLAAESGHSGAASTDKDLVS